MHLRPAKQSDLSTLADLSAATYLNDELYTFTHPRSHLYPDDFRRHWLRKLRRQLVTPGRHVLVCVDAGPPRDEGAIIGYGVFERSPSSTAQPSSLFNAINRALYTVEDAYSALTLPDRSEDTSAVRSFQRHISSQSDPFARVPTCWRPRSVAVAPWAQRRGAGKLMMCWVMERAREDDVPVCVAASEAGARLYRRVGFSVVDWAGFAFGNGSDIRMMVWDPKGRWVRRVREEEGEGWIVKRGVRLPVEAVWM